MSLLLMMILVISAISLIFLLWLSRDEFKARKKEAQKYVDELENPRQEEEYIYDLPEEDAVSASDDGLYEKPDEYQTTVSNEDALPGYVTEEVLQPAGEDAAEQELDYTPISDSYADDELQFVDVDGMVV